MPALAAVAVLGLLVPVHGAGAASTPTCLGRKATYVGTDKRDTITIHGEKDPVLVLKGGDDDVTVEISDGIIYICGGNGDDRVHIYDGGGFRYFGGDGKDYMLFQPRCGGPTDDGRTFKVEETVHAYCRVG